MLVPAGGMLPATVRHRHSKPAPLTQHSLATRGLSTYGASDTVKAASLSTTFLPNRHFPHLLRTKKQKLENVKVPALGDTANKWGASHTPGETPPNLAFSRTAC